MQQNPKSGSVIGQQMLTGRQFQSVNIRNAVFWN